MISVVGFNIVFSIDQGNSVMSELYLDLKLSKQSHQRLTSLHARLRKGGGRDLCSETYIIRLVFL